MVDFSRIEKIDMLKLRCTSPNLAKFFLHRSTTPTFAASQRMTKIIRKIREEEVTEQIMLSKKITVVDETFDRDSTNWCKTIVGIDVVSFFSLFVKQYPLVCTRNGK